MTDLDVTTPPTGGFCVRVSLPNGAFRAFQWHPTRDCWTAGTGHEDDAADPSCDQPVDGLTEAPEDAEDAARIVREWAG